MKRNELRGKTAIITGSSSGIGRATAIAFAHEGVNLVLAARNQDALLETKQKIQPFGVDVLVVPTDVTQREQIRYLVQESLRCFGKIDIFVNNAGVYFRCPVRELKIEDVERVMATNFYAYLYGLYEILPHMLERKTGHIVVVTSMDGKKGAPPDSAYVAAKFAATGFTEVLRQELRGTGVYVSTVFPGRVDTPMIANLSVPSISRKIPPEQVANAIVNAILNKKAEVFVPYLSSKTLILLNALSSGIGDWGIRFFHLEGWENK